jgi:thioredoxin 1
MDIPTYVDLQSIIKKYQFVVVDFHATWCGPCKLLAPKLDELAKANAIMRLVKVDIDKVPEASDAYGVQQLPTIVFFVNGKPARTVTGANMNAINKTTFEIVSALQRPT